MNRFVSPKALDSLSNAAGFDMSLVMVHKIGPPLGSDQTTTVDNTGETVELEDFWAMFLLVLPPGSDEQELCYQLRPLFPLVRFAHLNWTMKLTSAPNDGTYYNVNQASLHYTTAFQAAHINIEGAWDREVGKNFIKVGVADSGIRADHTDLQFNGVAVVAGGYNAIDPFNQPDALQDPFSHGTPVAGIIGAVRNNGLGIAGIAGGSGTAQGVSLYSLKSFNNSGIGTIAAFTDAVLTGSLPLSSQGLGLQIINFSGASLVSQDVRQFVDYAAAMSALRQASRNKVTVVVSAGNDALFGNDYLFPAHARDNWTLTVGGSDENGDYYREGPLVGNAVSTPHPFVDVVAPASNAHSAVQALQTVYSISSASPTSYQTFRRTSASAPHVAGVVALMMSNRNSATQTAENLQPEDIELLLKSCAKDIQTAPAQIGEDDETGAGLINATTVMEGFRNHVIYHSPAVSADPSVAGIEILAMGGPEDYYMEGGTRLFPGIYNAQAYRVRITANVGSNRFYQTTDRWGLSNSSSFYGPPVPFTGASFANYTLPSSLMVLLESEARVVGVIGKTQVILEGYTYQLNSFRALTRPSIAGQPYQISATSQAPPTSWIPLDPNNNPNQDGRSMRFASSSVYTGPMGMAIMPGEGSDKSESASRGGAYPNPATNRATLLFAATSPGAQADTQAEVQLTTITGQIVRSERQPVSWQPNETGAVELSLTGLPAGIYLYRILTSGNVCQGRLTKTE